MKLSSQRLERPLCLGRHSWGMPILLIAFTIACIGRAQTDNKPELVLQTGHASYVNRVAFSPDNRWLASASGDNTAKIWDLATGLELRTLRGHSNSVKALAFSSDGRLLASAGDDNLVKLWEVDSGREVFTMPTGDHIMGLVDVAFGPDGKRLISLNQDRTVTIWDVASGQRVSSFSAKGSSGTADFTHLTPNGRWVMSDVDGGAAVELWDVASGQRAYHHPKPIEESRWGPQAGDMNNPTLSPDGRWLVSTDKHMSVRLWDVAKGSMIYSLYGDPEADTNRTFSFAFSPDGKVLAVGDDDKQTVRLLDAATGRVLRTFEKTFAASLSFSDDGRKIAAVGNRSIAVLDLNTGRLLQTLQGYARSASAIAISNDGQFLAVGSEDYETKLWDLTLGREVRRFGGPPERLDAGATAVAFSSDGRWLAAEFMRTDASGSDESQLKIWESATGRELRTLNGFAIGVTSISFNPKGNLLAAGDYGGGLKIWDTATWQELQSLKGGTLSTAMHLAFSPDGRWLAAAMSGYRSNSISFWDTTTREWARTINVEVGVAALAFSPDSRRLASANNYRHTLNIWDVESGKPVLSIPNQTADVNGLAFRPDGRWLATAGEDHGVRLWDATGGQALRSFTGHASKVNAVVFSPDGHWLASASADGTVRIWDPTTGAAIALLVTISGSTDWVAMTADGLFDGPTEGAQKLVAWRIGNHLYPADRFYASNFTPGLLGRLLGGEKLKPGVSLDASKLPPEVRITSPSSGSKLKAGRVGVVVAAKDQGGGIAEVRLFQNGKLVDKRPGRGNGDYQFNVDLVAGENVLKASALSQDKVEANDDNVRLVVEAAPDEVARAKPALRLLVAGVSEYEDAAFDLNFARPDAEAIAGFFQKDKLFSSADATKLYDRDATKAAIQDSLAKLVERAQPEDVILIYLAGHGVGLGEQFYFLPHDMRREDDDDAAIRKYGIPASAVADVLMRAKALKQVLILDTCESESALPLLAKAMMFRSRGVSAAEEKAVKMLARSYGVYLIAASTRDQEAYEVQELGHGVLTYALLTGLGEKGQPKAPTASEGIITIESLVQYVHDQVPELTEKYHHQKQYAVTSTTGTDFPLWAQ